MKICDSLKHIDDLLCKQLRSYFHRRYYSSLIRHFFVNLSHIVCISNKDECVDILLMKFSIGTSYKGVVLFRCVKKVKWILKIIFSAINKSIKNRFGGLLWAQFKIKKVDERTSRKQTLFYPCWAGKNF